MPMLLPTTYVRRPRALRIRRDGCALPQRLPHFPAAWSSFLTQKPWRPGNAFTWNQSTSQTPSPTCPAMAPRGMPVDRHRNKHGEISHNHGNTLVRTLRKIYGNDFGPGIPRLKSSAGYWFTERDILEPAPSRS
jgi:hypothetical protein